MLTEPIINMAVKKNVEFKTRDGLTLRGLLTLVGNPNAPLLILLSPVRLLLTITDEIMLLTCMNSLVF